MATNQNTLSVTGLQAGASDYRFVVRVYCPTGNTAWRGFNFTTPATRLGLSTQSKEQLEEQLSLYPNPAKEYIKLGGLEQEGPVEVQVYNQLGQLVLTQALESSGEEIQLNGLSQGIYILKIAIGETVLHRRLVKE